jgi:hypothetical protein
MDATVSLHLLPSSPRVHPLILRSSTRHRMSPSYARLEKWGFGHETVCHGRGEYARVEHCIGHLKEQRRIATRYDKTEKSFVGFVLLVPHRPLPDPLV